mmetsp:Transcript_120479/g.340874  ORF Transcript_120479/g.340874 Transcript_120479/m.340874 type:complete len:304 (+) Transcript_120479:567-1478(+)
MARTRLLYYCYSHSFGLRAAVMDAEAVAACCATWIRCRSAHCPYLAPQRRRVGCCVFREGGGSRSTTFAAPTISARRSQMRWTFLMGRLTRSRLRLWAARRAYLVSRKMQRFAELWAHWSQKWAGVVCLMTSTSLRAATSTTCLPKAGCGGRRRSRRPRKQPKAACSSRLERQGPVRVHAGRRAPQTRPSASPGNSGTFGWTSKRLAWLGTPHCMALAEGPAAREATVQLELVARTRLTLPRPAMHRKVRRGPFFRSTRRWRSSRRRQKALNRRSAMRTRPRTALPYRLAILMARPQPLVLKR